MIFEVAHQISLMPMVLLIVVLGRGQVPNLDHVLLTAAFFMSWIGDSITEFIGGGFEYGYLWAPAQIILAYAAIVGTWSFRRIILVGAVCSSVVVASLLNADPGVLLWPLGGIGLIILGRRSSVRVPIFIYFGVGTIAYTFMVSEAEGLRLMGFWLLYQACRLVALLSLCALILPPQKDTDRVAYN